MRRHRFWLISLALVLMLLLGACRKSSPSPTSVPLPGQPTTTPTASPTPTLVLPTLTPAPPTSTPLPTWPDRWEPTGGPYGGLIQAVAVHPTQPNILYSAGAGGAIFRSTDGGETWSPGERLAPADCLFSSLVIDAANDGTLYAANTCAGIFITSDAGATWTHASASIAGGVTLLIQSPHAPGLLLASDHAGQVYRSQDGALTWEPIGAGLPGQIIHSLAASAPDIYWATTTNEQGDTLYRFTGGAWSPVSLGQPSGTDATSILVDSEDPTLLFVGLQAAQNAGLPPDAALLLRSTDAGISWSPLPVPPGGPGAVLNDRVVLLGQAQAVGLLYVATSAELLSSSDAGDTWTHVELPFATSDLRQIVADPADNDVLYLPLHGGGIAQSQDGGRSWRALEVGLSNTDIALLAPHPSEAGTLYAASASGDGTFKSTSYGDAWTRLDAGHLARSPASDLIVDPGHPDTLYQAMHDAGVLRSDDGGASWSSAWSDFRFSSIYALVAASSISTTLYANQSGFGLFRSDDSGNTWSFLSGPGTGTTSALAVHPDDADFILSGDSRKPFETSAGLGRSKDGGRSWDSPLQVPDAVGITSVAFDPRVEPYFPRGEQPADPTRLYAASVGSRGIFWYSNDAGDSWKVLNDDLNFIVVHTLVIPPHQTAVAYASLWGAGNWRTDDGGQSWHRLPGDPAASAAAIALDPSNHNLLYIADATTPHLYRSTDAGNAWELLFDAGTDFDRLLALALAPSDPTILYVSASSVSTAPGAGAVFRVTTDAPFGENATDVTGGLPGTPSSLAVHRLDPQRIFAATNSDGVWKTMDGGISWRQVKSGLPGIGFFQVVVDPVLPQTLFLIGGYDLRPEESAPTDPNEMHGIWKSTDDGNTWGRVGGATFGRVSGPIRAIAFHPEDERVMYAAGEGGIYLSPDSGETWTSINGRLPPFPMRTVATDGQTLFAGSAGAGLFSGTIHPLIHTADWVPKSRLAAPIDHLQLTLHPDDPQVLYVSAYPGGIFKTIDGGTTWRARDFGLPSFAVADPSRQGYYALAIAHGDPEVLYLGLYAQGVYRSADGAGTWRPVTGQQGALEAAGVQALLVHPTDPNTVYVATENGVWRTTDGGQNWEPFNSGLPPSADVRTLALGNDGQLYAGTRGYGIYTFDALHQTGDDTWRQLPALDPSGHPALSQRTSMLVHPTDPNTLYAGTPAGLFKTTDGGLTWREQNVGLGNVGILTLAFHPADQQTLYAGTTAGVARSVDAGATWHPWDAGWPPQQQVLSITSDPTNPDLLYACSSHGAGMGGTVMKSTDGGANWLEITTGLDADQTFLQILVDRFNPQLLYLATAADGVYISHDAGATWTSWNQGLWNRVAGGGEAAVAAVLQPSANGRLLYYGTSGSGVWRRPAAGTP
jgi:photosystem II stability/assembly factor-like uncharacterized protein